VRAGGAPVDASAGPPLAVPATFFLASLGGMAAAGAWLVLRGAACFAGSGAPASQALVHLLALGFLASAMLGALMQMLPVILGAPVPAPRLGFGVAAALLGGALLLAAGLAGLAPTAATGGALLGLAGLGFGLPVLLGLARSRVWTDTAIGVRLSLLGLVVLGCLGVGFASLRGGASTAVTLLPGSYLDWRSAHAGLALTVWLGGLLSAVSWQILPMFYTAPEVPRVATRASVAGLAGSLVGLPLCAALGWPMALGFVPGALAVWVVAPVSGARALARRRRRRTDYSVQSWQAALASGAAAAVLLALGQNTAAVWLALWGWGGLAVHGMLSRIVPFLLWFHRLSPLVGHVAVPPMRKLLPPTRLRTSLSLHGAALGAGLLAIATGSDALARLTGALVLATAAVLGRWLVAVLRTQAPTAD